MAEERGYPNSSFPPLSGEEEEWDKKPAAKERNDEESITLLNLDNGPLSEILGFLDLLSLAKTEGVCKKLRQTVFVRWNGLVEEILPEKGGGDDIWTAKHRVFRWVKATDYAKRMERIASRHFDYDTNRDPIMYGTNSVVRCSGCTAMPDLNRKLWPLTIEPPEFFIRLAYRKKNNEADFETQDTVICQGFMESFGMTSFRKYFFNLSEIYDREEVHWPEMNELLKLRDTNFEAFTRLFRKPNSAKVKKCFDNLAVTVVAMEKKICWTCSLVVATGGFVDTGIDSDGCRARLQFRWFQSHGSNRSSNEVPCCIIFQFRPQCSNTYPNRQDDSLDLILWRPVRPFPF